MSLARQLRSGRQIRPHNPSVLCQHLCPLMDALPTRTTMSQNGLFGPAAHAALRTSPAQSNTAGLVGKLVLIEELRAGRRIQPRVENVASGRERPAFQLERKAIEVGERIPVLDHLRLGRELDRPQRDPLADAIAARHAHGVQFEVDRAHEFGEVVGRDVRRQHDFQPISLHPAREADRLGEIALDLDLPRQHQFQEGFEFRIVQSKGGVPVGTPTGTDIRKVIELGITPRVNTGIAHKEAGVGQVGAGLVRPPMKIFEDALMAYAQQYNL